MAKGREQTMQHATRIEFTNHLMFNAVLTENEDLCIRLIEAVLGRDVQSVEYLEDEAVIQPTVDARGARLDVLALIDGEYVDIEMQVGLEPDIARRCRFYHSAIATRYAPKGLGYKDIPRSYVIFICLTDPLGAGLVRYELATSCINDPSVRVSDGATTIILNAQAWRLERNPEVSGLLEYALTGNVGCNLAKDIAGAVDSKNLDRRWVRASMGVMSYEHELIVLNRELEEKRAAVEAAKAEIVAAQAEVEAAQAEVEAKQAEVAAVQAEAEAAQAEVEAKQAEAEAMRAEAEAAQAEVVAKQAIQELSKRLYAAGRIDEYITALDNPQLMDALLKEFGLKE